ncbi:MAG: glycosyltransferase family 4 protein, partial [Lachnospiraceae bacterium]|nr:glycosyltransferase family 4 protein [Lachnospiraceae bacterium]
MRKRNVLIITYSMIPHASSWGGCQRMYYLAEYLIREGYNVTVCSAKTNEEQFYGKEIHFSTMPLEIKNKIFRNFVYSKKVSHSNKKTDHISANFIGKLRNIIKGKKTLFKILVKIDEWIFNEPSYLMGLISRNWISSWKKEISDYITENEIDTLIVSGPPFGMFSIVKYIKKKNHISVILDYRDPWNLWHKRSLFARLAEKKNMKYVELGKTGL